MYKLFEEFTAPLTLYHGDNFCTDSIKVENMDLGGNMQEGIGIYFTNDIKVAKGYGTCLIKTEVNSNNFIPSREPIRNYISEDEIFEILDDLMFIDDEAMFYLVSDYLYIETPSDLEEYHLHSLASKLSIEEARNFQITLAESFSVPAFVEAWNTNTTYIGTFEEKSGFYCIIDPEIKVEVIKNNLNESESFDDYPKAATENAKKALTWRDEYGRNVVKGGTKVGWARANQLAKRESLSRDVVSRMAQFNRHRKNSKIADKYKGEPWKDNGYLSWLLWGGDAGVDWAIRKMEQLRKNK